ncbi:MAG TPA: ABC transporter substrate-binding protein [Burkholderiales bacterium]
METLRVIGLKRWLCRLGAVTLALPLFAAGAAAQPIKVKVGYSVDSLAYAPVLLARDAGLFARHGLDAELVRVPGSAGQAALLGGEIQALASDSYRMYAIFAQGDTRMLMVQKIIDVQPFDLVMSKSWVAKTGVGADSPLKERFRSLKGSRLGTQSLGGAPQVISAYLARKGGLDPKTDLRFIQLNSVPATVAGLQQGQIDGYMLSAPNSIKAEKEGFGVVLVGYDQVDEFLGVPYNSLIVEREYAKSHRDVIERIVAAIGDARIMLSSEPYKAAKALHKSFSRIDEELFTDSVVRYKAAFPDRGKFDQAGIDRNIALGAGAGLLKGSVKVKADVNWSNEFFK